MDEIAEWLNDHGHVTTLGGPFTQVLRLAAAEALPGRRFPGKVKDRGGNPQIIKAMEKPA